MDEMITKKQAIDAITDELDRIDHVPQWIFNRLEKAIKELPSAQPYTIHSDGRLWITVDDIDKVRAVVVDEHKSKFCKQFYEDYEDAQPEIIRCKDCKHRDPEDHKCDCGHDILWQLPRPDDWFCGDGERKDGDTDG